jgi:hypothetical protein
VDDAGRPSFFARCTFLERRAHEINDLLLTNHFYQTKSKTASDLGEAAAKAVRITEILGMAEDANIDVKFELPM